jgi:hypothetical protein
MRTIIFILFFGIFSTGFSSTAIPPHRFTLTEESYINDIPFNTRAIFCRFIKCKVMNLKLQDEPTVDDIPFNTSEISAKILNQNPAGKTILKEEAYIDDIPFHTSVIASNAIDNGMVTLQ